MSATIAASPRLIHDWNAEPALAHGAAPRVLDETLRDGLQAPSARVPAISEQIALLHAMALLGVDAANLGMPACGERARRDVLALAREVADARLPLVPGAAARTRVEDVRELAGIAQAAGIAVEAGIFVPASALRHEADGRSMDDALRCGEAAVGAAVRAGLPVMFVAEDATRARPEALRALLGGAIRWGATRLCLADTAGHATPAGARRLVRFVLEEIIAPTGAAIAIDWHGHDDRGLALGTALAALDAGADRVHATALGIGERAGNVAMEQLLANLHLEGRWSHPLAALPGYAALAARACGVEVAPGRPVVGRDAFRTGSGVHAASLLRARRAGDRWLEDRVFSAVPASVIGRAQRVDVSPVSGRSNVRAWLAAHGHDADDRALCESILAAAKRATRALDDAELEALVTMHRRADAPASRARTPVPLSPMPLAR